MMKHSLVITAAGEGSRFGGRKLAAEIGGNSVLDWVFEAVLDFFEWTEIVVVGNEIALKGTTKVIFVEGGATRQASVRNGVLALSECDRVWIHDGARPFVSPELMARLMGASETVEAVVPGLAVRETLKRVSEGCVLETVDRSDLVAIQTPQVFSYERLVRAYGKIGDAIYTDEAGIFEAIGETVSVVHGDARNIKITYPEDLAIACALAEGRRLDGTL